MFHIFFSADENYLKYLASLIHSIVKETKVDYPFTEYLNRGWEGDQRLKSIGDFSDEELKEGYIFHILTNAEFSEEQNDNLKRLAALLSDFYPCQITVHIIDEQFFIKNKAPIWKGNYQTYFRFFVSDFVGSEVKCALYLDVDMLVLDDLRKLWTIDTRQNVLMVAKLPQVFKSNMFNAGFIFFNLEHWREGMWKLKCLEYTKNHKSLDQDTLNAVLDRDKILFISHAWDYCFQTYQSDNEEMLRLERRDDFVKRICIIHYIRPKPWDNIIGWFYKSRGKCLRYQNIIDLWWDNALKTPVYSSELLDLKLKLNNDAESCISNCAKRIICFTMGVRRLMRRVALKIGIRKDH